MCRCREFTQRSVNIPSFGSECATGAKHTCIVHLESILAATVVRSSMAQPLAAAPWQCRQSGPIWGAILRPQNRAGNCEPQLLGFTLCCLFFGGPESGPKIGVTFRCESHLSTSSHAACASHDKVRSIYLQSLCLRSGACLFSCLCALHRLA